MATVAGKKYASKLAGARVLVLGGTSGIGFCVAEAALEFGASVFVSSSKPDNVVRAIERLRAAYPGTQVDGCACDLAERRDQEAALTTLLDTATANGTVKLDHLVMTAGNRIAFPSLPDMSTRAFDDVGAVRFLGAVNLAKLSGPYLKPGLASSITLTGGGLAHRPNSRLGSLVPAMSAAMEGLVRGLAVELRPLRVNCVAPGAVATDHINSSSPEARAAALDAFRKMTLLDCVGRPEDVAEAYVYAMRDHFLTGSVINSNGGLFLA